MAKVSSLPSVALHPRPSILPLLTRALVLGYNANQALYQLHQLLLLLLQGAGIAAEGLQILLQVGQGSSLVAQEALQLLPLVLEAVHLGLVLGFQSLQPALQCPARWGTQG